MFDFTVTATDAMGCTGSQVYRVNIQGGGCTDCPTIMRIKSRSGKPGTRATIIGTGFSKVSRQNRVTFGLYLAKVSKATSKKLTVTIPKKLKKGQVVNVSVSVNGNVSSPVPFQVK